MASAQIGVQILGDASSLNRAFLSAEAGATKFTSRMSKANESTRGVLSGSGLGRTSLLFGSTAFLGGALAGGAIEKTISGAEDLNKAISATNLIFGKSSQIVKDWSSTTADSMGIARVQALKAADTFGLLFHNVGLAPARAADLSQGLVKLAADLGSLKDADPSQVLTALRAGLTGQLRGLKQYGILINNASVQQQAMADTGKKNANALTNQELVLARYEIIMQQTSLVQGNFARDSGTLANQTKVLKAGFSDLSDELGNALIPSAVTVVQDLNALIGLGKKAKEFFSGTGDSAETAAGQVDKFDASVGKAEHKNFFQKGFLGRFLHGASPGAGVNDFLKNAAKNTLEPGVALKGFLQIIGIIPAAIDHATDRLKLASGGLGEFAADARGATIATGDFTDSLKSLETQANALTFKSLKLQADNAPLDQRIAAQKQIIANDKRIVAGTPSGSKSRRQALNQQIADQNQLASLQGQVTQKQAAAQAKIDQQRQDAITAESNRISKIFQGFDVKLSNAQLTPGLKDDLKVLNQELVTVLKLEKTHKNNLDLQQREVDIRGQIIGLQKQQADQQSQQLKDAQDQAKSLFGTLFQQADQASTAFLGGSRGKRTIAVPGETGGPTTAKDLLTSITQQNKSFAQLTSDIGVLAKRGAPASLLTAAKSGQISAAQVDALAKASPKVLERIFGQVRRADKLIASATKMELRANTVTVDAKTLKLTGAGAGDRGTTSQNDRDVTVKVFLDGKQIEQSQVRRSKKRANQRRGRVGGTR